ncbi:MAG: hypothetical protein M1818_006189 [Claussenomyces sp. TS43310]|nr:MAG: hypothetical protein M1818_006189 [Claussenomyces sp. TS43310]
MAVEVMNHSAGRVSKTTAFPAAKPMDQTVAESPPTPESLSSSHIIDIRNGKALEMNLKVEISSKLKPENGPKQLPTLLLYDDKGLQLFEEITYLDEYYLTNAEINVLHNSASEIAQHVQSGSMVIELGSGNLRKVSILLEALESAGKDIDYYALDLSLAELERTLGAVPPFMHVRCHGLHGTYDDALVWLKTGEAASRPKCILSLGSSIGNFSRTEAVSFLRGFTNVLRPCDSMLVGLDACYDSAKVYNAYNDKKGVTHKFILNGLSHANTLLREKVFDVDEWEVIGEFIHDKEGGRHQAFYAPKKDVLCCDVRIKAGERVQVEQSLKYSKDESRVLWARSELREVGKWSASTESYSKIIPNFAFHQSSNRYFLALFSFNHL